MDEIDDSVRNMSLLDKVKIIEKLKKLKEVELKDKEEELSKEIDELQEKRKKEIKDLEEQLKKEETALDEEMVKALNEMFFRDRRRYLMNRARLERKVEFTESEEESSGQGPRGESFLYSLSERIFAGENIKLQEITSFTTYHKMKDETDRHYSSAVALQDSSYLEDLARAVGGYSGESDLYESLKKNNSDSYSRNNQSALERLDEELNSRRNYY
jgi:DNA-binding protein H-NS